MASGWRVTELTGRSGPLTPGAGCITPRGLPSGDAWRALAISRMVDFFNTVNRRSADLIFIQFAQGMWSWLAPITGLPIAVSVMGGDILMDEQGSPSFAERMATHGLLRRAGLVLCASDHLAAMVRRLKPRGVVQTICWGPDRTVFRPGSRSLARRQLNLPQGGYVVFSPRVMQPLYRIIDVVDAFALAFGDMADARLAVCTLRADRHYLDRVRKRAEALGVAGRTCFLPPQTARQMAYWYQAADVCVSFPLSDGLPQSLLEAALCGTPMVLSDIPHYHRTFQHGCQALLAGPGAQALAAAFTAFKNRPALARELGLEAQSAVRRLGVHQTAERLQARLGAHIRRSTDRRGDLHQIFWVLMALAWKRPIVARRGQPVYPSAAKYLRSQFAAKKPPCVA